MAKLAFMSVIFEYKASDLSQYYRIEYFDEINKKIKNPEIPYGLKNFGPITENGFWPPTWGTTLRTHKAAAFWPKYNEIYYFYNIDETEYNNLYTKRLTDNNWTDSWRYYIFNKDKTYWYKKYRPLTPITTAFWWIKDDRIYTTSGLLSNPRNAKVRILNLSNKDDSISYESRVSIFTMKQFLIINLSDYNQACEKCEQFYIC
jgi:hypothetical protein